MSALDGTVSSARLGPYMKSAGFNSDRAIKLYLWNVAIGQSFHFPLQAFEVAFRNSVSGALVNEFGAIWWRPANAKKFLSARSLEEVQKTHKRLRNKGIKPNADDMVAGLSFGFWVSLLAARYKPVIWSKRLAEAFPNMPNGTTQKIVYEQSNGALNLRNRIFHHEPLISQNLSAEYADLMRLLTWLCPETQKWVKANCSVPTVMRLKP